MPDVAGDALVEEVDDDAYPRGVAHPLMSDEPHGSPMAGLGRNALDEVGIGIRGPEQIEIVTDDAAGAEYAATIRAVLAA